MAEPVDLLRIRPSLCRVDLQVVEVRSAPTRQEKAGWVPCKLQVLQVVIVARQIEVHLVFAKQGVPIAN